MRDTCGASLWQHQGDGVASHLPSILWLQMVEYKSARDVETFSKFLENGGTLPEEPPVVSGVPQPQGQGLPPTLECLQTLLGGQIL